MKKLLPFIAAGVIVIGGIVFVVSRGGDDKISVASPSVENVKTGDDAIINVDACDVLTEAVAKQILGDAAEKGDTSAGAVSSNDVSVTNCVYFVKSSTGTALERLKSVKGVSVLARSAKSKTGAESKKAVFAGNLPTGAVAVEGIGDKAFFSENSSGQLSVLKGGNYYIVSNYTGNPAVGTLDADKELARLLNFK
jgi:hypothetical protein